MILVGKGLFSTPAEGSGATPAKRSRDARSGAWRKGFGAKVLKGPHQESPP